MAFINSGKHIEKEMNGVRVRVVEDGASKDRMEFLKGLLEHNNFEVLTEENVPKPPLAPKPDDQDNNEPNDKSLQEPTEPTWIIGVTDIVLNPVVAVYNRELKTLDGKRVTPDYWNQLTNKTEPNYWDLDKKKF